MSIADDRASDDSDRKLQLGHLFEDRKLLVGIQQDMRKGIDQAVLALSSAALGLSLTVVKDIADAEPTHVYLLVSAWVLFGIGILGTLSAMWSTSIAVRRRESMALLNYHALLREKAVDGTAARLLKRQSRQFGRLSEVLQFASVIAFAFGIIAVGVFVFYNLPGA